VGPFLMGPTSVPQVWYVSSSSGPPLVLISFLPLCGHSPLSTTCHPLVTALSPPLLLPSRALNFELTKAQWNSSLRVLFTTESFIVPTLADFSFLFVFLFCGGAVLMRVCCTRGVR